VYTSKNLQKSNLLGSGWIEKPSHGTMSTIRNLADVDALVEKYRTWIDQGVEDMEGKPGLDFTPRNQDEESETSEPTYLAKSQGYHSYHPAMNYPYDQQHQLSPDRTSKLKIDLPAHEIDREQSSSPGSQVERLYHSVPSSPTTSLHKEWALEPHYHSAGPLRLSQRSPLPPIVESNTSLATSNGSLNYGLMDSNFNPHQQNEKMNPLMDDAHSSQVKVPSPVRIRLENRFGVGSVPYQGPAGPSPQVPSIPYLKKKKKQEPQKKYENEKLGMSISRYLEAQFKAENQHSDLGKQTFQLGGSHSRKTISVLRIRFPTLRNEFPGINQLRN
jgi:hypothetical protein